MQSTIVLTAVAMLAFAANSLLAREALGTLSIEAAGYTAVRIMSENGVGARDASHSTSSSVPGKVMTPIRAVMGDPW